MAVCRATKRNGERCTAPATGANGFCWAHDPQNAEQRRRAASRGGKARAYSETQDTHATKDQLQEVADRVLVGDLDPPLAYAATAALNGKLRALEILRKWREADEISARLDEIERRLDASGTKPYGGRRQR
jgi:uncharacterized protein DUF5763